MALRRENVAREIYRTEHSYVHNLRILVHIFLSTLEASHWYIFLSLQVSNSMLTLQSYRQVRGGQPIELEKMKILSRRIAPILGNTT